MFFSARSERLRQDDPSSVHRRKAKASVRRGLRFWRQTGIENIRFKYLFSSVYILEANMFTGVQCTTCQIGLVCVINNFPCNPGFHLKQFNTGNPAHN